ncbi:MAG: WG repeat-containing protein [Bacteroidales bacterium]|nr:WG repeat-containing protein [Bacteroidales bacterium]
MKRIILILAAVFATLSLAAQIPPVPEAKIVAVYCRHCGLINLEKGETHRSDCPYVNGGDESSSGSSSYGSGRLSYGERHEAAWEARKAAKEARKAEREARKAARNAEKYARAKKVKLKDYQPMAGKTVVAPKGATDNTQVIAKYDRQGVPTYGLKDKSGKWVKKPQYQAITIVGPAAAAYKKKGKAGLLDPNTGEPLLAGDYDQYQAFYYPDNARNTMVALGRHGADGNTEWHLMKADENGDYVDALVCSSAEFFEDGTGRKIAYRRADTQKVGLADEKGGEILPPVFDGLKYLDYSVDGASYYQARMVQADGKSALGVIDDSGRMVIPCTYDKVDAKTWGKYGIKVEKDGKEGVYDINGNQLFPASFEKMELDHFWDGIRHRAYFRGFVTQPDGTRRSALFDTRGNQLTDFGEESAVDYFQIKDRAAELEEYRIY